MDDLISRADAIDAIERTGWYHQAPNGEMVHGANSAKHQAWYKEQDVYKALENVPTAQRWIPVTEQLPEKNGLYLVTYQNWGALEVDWNIWIAEQKPSWLWEQGVTAWMPLPEAYEPTKEEET